MTYNSIYSATKSGLITWTKTVADEYDDVYFSAICPGFVSEVGMHAARKMKAPFIAKEITPDRVVDLVVRTLKDKRREVLVSASPVRPLLAAWELVPGIKDVVYRNTGLRAFMKKIEKVEKERRGS